MIMGSIFSLIANAFKMDKLAIYFILGLLLLAAFIIIPNLNGFKEFFGIDTVNSLRVEVAKEIKNTEVVANINDNLNATIETHEASAEVNMLVTEVRAVKVAKVVKKVEKIQTKVQKVVVDETASYETKSEAIIDGLWETYCETSKQCNETKEK